MKQYSQKSKYVYYISLDGEKLTHLEIQKLDLTPVPHFFENPFIELNGRIIEVKREFIF